MLPGEGDQVRLLDPAAGEKYGTGPEDPLAARSAELGRDAGQAAATWVFDGSTPGEAYRRVLRGIEDGVHLPPAARHRGKHAGERQTFSVHEVVHNHVEWVGGRGHYDLDYAAAIRLMAEKVVGQA